MAPARALPSSAQRNQYSRSRFVISFTSDKGQPLKTRLIASYSTNSVW